MINLLIITTELVVTAAKTVASECLHGELEDKPGDKKLYRLARARKMRVCGLDQVKSSRTRMKRFWCHNKFGPRPHNSIQRLRSVAISICGNAFKLWPLDRAFGHKNIGNTYKAYS